LNREFQAEQGREKRVSDLTYPRTRNGWVYLTVVLDRYDRKVIGWAFSADILSTNMLFDCKLFCIGQTENHRPV
jgi:transposase InsO family protein